MSMIKFILRGLLMTCFVNGIEVILDTQKVHRVINPKFINVAIDTGVIRKHWENFRPKSTKIKTLAAGLAPCYMRVGGTEADFLIFQNDKASRGKMAGRHEKDFEHVGMKEFLKANWTGSRARSKRDVGDWDNAQPLTNFTMTASFYDQIHEYVSSVGWELIFDLNSLLRKPNGAWDSANAIQLINYTAESGYKMGGWELGNEPNAYFHKTGYRVEPEQLAKDFVVLHKLLGYHSQFANAQLLGPSVTQLNKKRTDKFFESFMSSGGGDVVTAATFHQYYEDGADAEAKDFYNPQILNLLYEEVQTGMNLTRAAGSRAKLWLGETSSAWRGGAPGISDRYVAGFAWLDKLGMSARDGIDALIRQTFYGGHYALLDHETLDPNPVSMIQGLLVDLVVQTASWRQSTQSNLPDSSGRLRVYAHCTETVKSGYPQGSVTVYVMNLGESSTTVEFPSGTQLHVYHMSPPDNDLLAQSVMLNGKLVQMIDDKTLPDLLYPMKTTDSVNVDARTYSFVVIPDAKLSVCM